MDSRAVDYSALERNRMLAAGLLTPPHGSVNSGLFSPTLPESARGLGPPPYDRPPAAGAGAGAGGAGGDLSGSAASAISSLAQLQGRYLPHSLAMHGLGGNYPHSLMAQYLGQSGGAPEGCQLPGASNTLGGASDPYKAHLPPVSAGHHYWPRPTHPSLSEGGYGGSTYGLGPSVYAPYLSLLSGAMDGVGTPLLAPPGPLPQSTGAPQSTRDIHHQSSIYQRIYQLRKEAILHGSTPSSVPALAGLYNQSLGVTPENGRGNSQERTQGGNELLPSPTPKNTDVPSVYSKGMGQPSPHHRGRDLHSPHHRGSDLHSPHHRGSDLQSPHHRGSDLHSPHHRGSDLQSPHHRGSDLHSPPHRGSDLHSPPHRGSDLHSPHHRGSDLHSPPHRGIDLHSPHHRGSDLHSPHHRGSDQPSPHHRGSDQPSPYHRGSDQPSPTHRQSGQHSNDLHFASREVSPPRCIGDKSIPQIQSRQDPSSPHPRGKPFPVPDHSKQDGDASVDPKTRDSPATPSGDNQSARLQARRDSRMSSPNQNSDHSPSGQKPAGVRASCQEQPDTVGVRAKGSQASSKRLSKAPATPRSGQAGQIRVKDRSGSSKSSKKSPKSKTAPGSKPEKREISVVDGESRAGNSGKDTHANLQLESANGQGPHNHGSSHAFRHNSRQSKQVKPVPVEAVTGDSLSADLGQNAGAALGDRSDFDGEREIGAGNCAHLGDVSREKDVGNEDDTNMEIHGDGSIVGGISDSLFDAGKHASEQSEPVNLSVSSQDSDTQSVKSPSSSSSSSSSSPSSSCQSSPEKVDKGHRTQDLSIVSECSRSESTCTSDSPRTRLDSDASPSLHSYLEADHSRTPIGSPLTAIASSVPASTTLADVSSSVTSTSLQAASHAGAVNGGRSPAGKVGSSSASASASASAGKYGSSGFHYSVSQPGRNRPPQEGRRVHATTFTPEVGGLPNVATPTPPLSNGSSREAGSRTCSSSSNPADSTSMLFLAVVGTASSSSLDGPSKDEQKDGPVCAQSQSASGGESSAETLACRRTSGDDAGGERASQEEHPLSPPGTCTSPHLQQQPQQQQQQKQQTQRDAEQGKKKSDQSVDMAVFGANHGHRSPTAVQAGPVNGILEPPRTKDHSPASVGRSQTPILSQPNTPLQFTQDLSPTRSANSLKKSSAKMSPQSSAEHAGLISLHHGKESGSKTLSTVSPCPPTAPDARHSTEVMSMMQHHGNLVASSSSPSVAAAATAAAAAAAAAAQYSHLPPPTHYNPYAYAMQSGMFYPTSHSMGLAAPPVGQYYLPYDPRLLPYAPDEERARLVDLGWLPPHLSGPIPGGPLHAHTSDHSFSGPMSPLELTTNGKNSQHQASKTVGDAKKTSPIVSAPSSTSPKGQTLAQKAPDSGEKMNKSNSRGEQLGAVPCPPAEAAKSCTRSSTKSSNREVIVAPPGTASSPRTSSKSSMRVTHAVRPQGHHSSGTKPTSERGRIDDNNSSHSIPVGIAVGLQRTERKRPPAQTSASAAQLENINDQERNELGEVTLVRSRSSMVSSRASWSRETARSPASDPARNRAARAEDSVTMGLSPGVQSLPTGSSSGVPRLLLPHSEGEGSTGSTEHSGPASLPDSTQQRNGMAQLQPAPPSGGENMADSHRRSGPCPSTSPPPPPSPPLPPEKLSGPNRHLRPLQLRSRPSDPPAVVVANPTGGDHDDDAAAGKKRPIAIATGEDNPQSSRLQPIPVPAGHRLAQDTITGGLYLVPDPDWVQGLSGGSDLSSSVYGAATMRRNGDTGQYTDDQGLYKPESCLEGSNVPHAKRHLPSRDGQTGRREKCRHAAGKHVQPVTNSVQQSQVSNDDIKRSRSRLRSWPSQCEGQSEGSDIDVTSSCQQIDDSPPSCCSSQGPDAPRSAMEVHSKVEGRSAHDPAQVTLRQRPVLTSVYSNVQRTVESRGTSPIVFSLPAEKISVAIATDTPPPTADLSTCCAAVQTCADDLPTKDSSAQTADSLKDDLCMSLLSLSKPTEASMNLLNQRMMPELCGVDACGGGGAQRSWTELQTVETVLSLVESHRNSPPVLTKITDLGFSKTPVSSGNSCQSSPVPRSRGGAEGASSTPALTSIPVSLQTAGLNVSCDPLNVKLCDMDKDRLQGADGLQLLSMIAECAYQQYAGGDSPTYPPPEGALQEGDADRLSYSSSNQRAASPDINKNYNAPKACYFENEDFAKSTANYRKSGDQTAVTQWTSNMLKIATGPEDMDSMELEMRMRLAELQRRYKEKQRELSRLNKRERDDERSQLLRRGPGRPRKRKFSRLSQSDSSGQAGSSESESKRRASTSCIEHTVKRTKSISSIKTEPMSPTAKSPKAKVTMTDTAKVKAKAAVSEVESPAEVLAPDAKTVVRTMAPLMEAIAEKQIKQELIQADQSEDPCHTDTDASLSQDTSDSQTGPESGGLGLLAEFAASQVEVLQTSVAAATSAALKYKKRKKLGDDSGLKDLTVAVPVKKRKPGRPKKIDDDKGGTEMIVSKKPKNFTFYNFNKSSCRMAPKPHHGLKPRPKSLGGQVHQAIAKLSSTASTPTSALSCTTTSSSSSSSKSQQHRGSVPERKPSSEKKGAPSVCSEEWYRRRSERIFLSEAMSPVSTKKDPFFETPSKEAMATTLKPSVPTLPATTVSPPATSQPNKSPSLLLKGKSSHDRSKIKAVHDLSQKVKKKYAKPSGHVKSGSSSRPLPSTAAANPVACQKLHFDVDLDLDSDSDSSSDGDDVPLSTLRWRSVTPQPKSCVIQNDNLQEGLRVLLFKEGLFYEGHVKCIQPPDVYGVVIDGERGSRPHILSREEMLNQAVLDVKPFFPRHVPVGTRVCAYWSQQFSCLYPGTVAKDSPNPHADKHLITVEFDDGDSGKIPLSHIRMLPPDFPIEGSDYSDGEMQSTMSPRRRTTSDDLLVSEVRDRRPSVSDTLCSYQPGDSCRARKRVLAKLHKKPSIKREDDDERQEEHQPIKSAEYKTGSKKDDAHSSPSQKKTMIKKSEKASPSKPLKSLHKQESDGDSANLFKRFAKFGKDGELPPLRLPTNNLHNKVKGHKDDNQSQMSTDSSKVSHDENSQSEYSDSYSEDEDEDDGDGDEEEEDESCSSDETWEDSHSTKPSPSKKAQSSPSKRPQPASKTSPSKARKSSSKAFLPARHLWTWLGKGTKRPGLKGKAKREYYKAIQRGKEILRVGDCALFMSVGRPTLPYVGRIESLWEGWGGNMVVKVKWFYHPEETKGGKKLAEIRGALYESPHTDENDVQTISHKCEVLSYTKWKVYRVRLREGHQHPADLDPEDVYYLAGTYEPTIGMITFEPDVKLL